MITPLLVCFLALVGASSTVSFEFHSTHMDTDHFAGTEHYMATSRLRRLVIEFIDYYQNITLSDLNLYQNSFVPTAQDLQCLEDLLLLIQELSSGRIWPLRMIDSWGSLPSGILYGNMWDLGHYDECLNVDHAVSTSHSVRGKYCFAKVSLASSTLSLLSIKTAVCFPASCSAAHMDTMLRRLFEKLLNVEISTDLQFVDENTCRSAEKKPYDGLTIFTIVVLSVLCALMVLSTLYDYLFIEDQKQFSPLVKAFSARANSRVLFRIVDTKSNPNIIDCLHGMRCLSFIWVVYGHDYLVASMGPNMNYVDMLTWFNSAFRMLITQGIYAVDTFFFLSGLLLVLIVLRVMERTKGKLNIPMMYLNRYLRLTPVLALAIPMYMKILPLLGDGPLYGSVSVDDYASCSDSWYLTLLYVQNYAAESICVSHSWYLAVDMQLYIIAPFLLISLYKWGRKGAAGIFVLMLLLASCLFSMMVINKISMSSPSTNPMKKIYYSTHTRASPYLIGILFGYFLYINRVKPYKLSRPAVFVGWLVSLALIFTCIFAVYGKQSDSYSILEEAFNLTLTRIAWPLGLCWVVFACMHGYGGLANSFLSSPLWQPLSKLSYSAYIFHMFIESFNGGITRTNTYFSDYQMMLRFWSDFGFTLLLAFLMYILIEAPFGNLQSHLLQTRKSSSKSEGDAQLRTTVFEGPTNESAPGPTKEETPATCHIQE